MMMKMLEAGGLAILTDNLREADANNPKGYYEFERVKQMKDGDLAWLPDAVGKVVKIVTGLIMFLPSDYNYKVIFMQRNLNEVLSSQKKMLGRLGKVDDNIPDDKMAKVYEEHLKQVKGWLIRQPNVEVRYLCIVYIQSGLLRYHKFRSRSIGLRSGTSRVPNFADRLQDQH